MTTSAHATSHPDWLLPLDERLAKARATLRADADDVATGFALLVMLRHGPVDDFWSSWAVIAARQFTAVSRLESWVILLPDGLVVAERKRPGGTLPELVQGRITWDGEARA